MGPASRPRRLATLPAGRSSTHRASLAVQRLIVRTFRPSARFRPASAGNTSDPSSSQMRRSGSWATRLSRMPKPMVILRKNEAE
jgi:hypothetical protein